MCFRLLIAILIVLALPPNAVANPKTERLSTDPLTSVQQESIQIHYHFFRLRLMRGGKTLSAGFFGQNYGAVFAGVPMALAKARRYHIMRSVGFAFWLAGAITSGTGLILRFTDHPAMVDNTRTGLKRWRPAAWGVIVTGATLGLTGALLFQLSQTYLTAAVNLYNKDVYRRARQRLSVGIAPGPGRAMVVLSGQF